ncbi:MAG TPA: hypothetical protein VF857_06105 [Spirochaetota bacterium]
MSKSKGKKKGKSGGHRSHKGGSKKGTGKDFLGIVTDENVLIGAITGIGVAMVTDGFLSQIVPNIHARNAIKAVVPALAVNTLLKNQTATTVAAGVGVTLGLGAYLESMVKKSVPQAKGMPNQFAQTAGMIGEDVFVQTQGAQDPSRVIEMQPNVEGDYEAVYNVSGDYIGKRIKAPKQSAAPRQYHDRLAGVMYNDQVSGDEEQVNGELEGLYDEQVNGELYGFADRIA